MNDLDILEIKNLLFSIKQKQIDIETKLTEQSKMFPRWIALTDMCKKWKIDPSIVNRFIKSNYAENIEWKQLEKNGKIYLNNSIIPSLEGRYAKS